MFYSFSIVYVFAVQVYSEGLFITPWCVITVYSAKPLSDVAKRDSSVLSHSLNLKVEFPVIADHDMMNNNILPRKIVPIKKIFFWTKKF